MTTSDLLLLQTMPTYEQPKLKSMPLREQPAYRVAQNATACNLTELLAAVIGGQKQIEIAQALMARFDGDIRRVYQSHPVELAKVKGINQVTAVRIKAALNLGLRLNLPNEERPTINSPADAAALVQYEMALLEKEHLRVILLDQRNHVLEIVEVYQGSVNSSQVRIAEIFQTCYSANGSCDHRLFIRTHRATRLLRRMTWQLQEPLCRQANFWIFPASIIW